MAGSDANDAIQLGLGASDAVLESPRYYVKLFESEELRRRLLLAKFRDPRNSSLRDSATLLDILDLHNDDPARRMEIASRHIEKVISVGFDLNTNLVWVDVRLRWSELAATAANRAVALADALAQEQQRTRAQSRLLFVTAMVEDARSAVAVAEDNQRSFEDRNRQWRNSPELASTEERLSRNAWLATQRLVSQVQHLELARLDERNQESRITVVDRAVPPSKAQWPRYGQLLASALSVSALLGLLVAAIAAFISAPRQAARPIEIPPPNEKVSFLGRIGFPIFAWGLVFHSLVITALFGWFGMPVDTVRSIAAWKEIGLAVLLALALLRTATGRGPGTTVAWSDLWIGGLIVTAILFLLIENLWLRFNLPRVAELMGFRDAVYFMLLYFVGRSMPELVSKEGAMRGLFALVVVTAVIGVVERLIVSPEMLVGLGVASYFQDFLGVSAFTVGNIYGLPLNYWTMIGGHLFRRAGSVYLSGQGFAVPFLLFFPLATAWVFLRPSRSRAQIAAYVIISASLILTLTRMTILIALIQLVLFVSVRKRPEWAVAGLLIASAVLVSAFALVPGFPTFVWQTLSWQEGSSVSHVSDWANGIATFFQNPWGSGLGTTDQTAVRAGLKHITGDNLYLKYGVEMGALGLGLLVLVLISVGRAALRLYRNGVTHAQQRMGITLWLAAIGIAINGITAVVFNSITLGWLFFWLAGAAVTVAQTLPHPTMPSEPAT
jgi:hypothetical protein